MIFLLIVGVVILVIALFGAGCLFALWLLNKLTGEAVMKGLNW